MRGIGAVLFSLEINEGLVWTHADASFLISYGMSSTAGYMPAAGDME